MDRINNGTILSYSLVINLWVQTCVVVWLDTPKANLGDMTLSELLKVIQ